MSSEDREHKREDRDAGDRRAYAPYGYPRHGFLHTVKTIVITALVVLLVVAAFLVGRRFSSGEEAALVDLPDVDVSGVVSENRVLNMSILDEIISQASELVTTTYYYKDAAIYEESKSIGSWTIPLTTDKTVFTYGGTIRAGIDFSQLSYEIDEEAKLITVHLPEPYIISHEVDEDSFEFYDVRNSVFTQAGMADYAALVSELKGGTEARLAEDSDFYDTVLQNAKVVITGFLHSAEATQEYRVVYE